MAPVAGLHLPALSCTDPAPSLAQISLSLARPGSHGMHSGRVGVLGGFPTGNEFQEPPSHPYPLTSPGLGGEDVSVHMGLGPKDPNKILTHLGHQKLKATFVESHLCRFQ